MHFIVGGMAGNYGQTEPLLKKTKLCANRSKQNTYFVYLRLVDALTGRAISPVQAKSRIAPFSNSSLKLAGVVGLNVLECFTLLKLSTG